MRQEIRWGRGVWEGGWQRVALDELTWACLRSSEEDSDHRAGHPQGRVGWRRESKEAGGGPGTYGFADHAKDFEFYSKCHGKPLKGFDGGVT